MGTDWAQNRHWADFEYYGKHLIVNAISWYLKKDCYISTTYQPNLLKYQLLRP
jgi:hypothetical protein